MATCAGIAHLLRPLPFSNGCACRTVAVYAGNATRSRSVVRVSGRGGGGSRGVDDGGCGGDSGSGKRGRGSGGGGGSGMAVLHLLLNLLLHVLLHLLLHVLLHDLLLEEGQVLHVGQV